MLEKMNEQEKRQANGGSVAAMMNMRWISIVPYYNGSVFKKKI